jgi:hypothetical protein
MTKMKALQIERESLLRRIKPNTPGVRDLRARLTIVTHKILALGV